MALRLTVQNWPQGNPYTHVILRGSSKGPNYAAEHVSACVSKLTKAGVTTKLMVRTVESTVVIGSQAKQVSSLADRLLPREQLETTPKADGGRQEHRKLRATTIEHVSPFTDLLWLIAGATRGRRDCPEHLGSDVGVEHQRGQAERSSRGTFWVSLGGMKAV